MSAEHARDRDAVTQQDEGSATEPSERLVEQRGPVLTGADWFFAHAVTMRAAHVPPVATRDEPVVDDSGQDDADRREGDPP